MYEITKAVSKFYDELSDEGFEPELSYTLTNKYAEALIASYGEFNNLQAELNEDLNEPEEDDEEEGDRTLGTYYVNIEPRVEKVREVLEELSKLSSDKPKYA